jgi:hypothetical protein
VRQAAEETGAQGDGADQKVTQVMIDGAEQSAARV